LAAPLLDLAGSVLSFVVFDSPIR